MNLKKLNRIVNMGYKIIIKQGNLINEEYATFIVNASNTRLVLGTGVSMAFKQRCGRELQKEMIEAIEKVGHPLQKGDVVITSSGRARNFEHALHACVMDYNPGLSYKDKAPSLMNIYEILLNIEQYLKLYEEKTSKPTRLVLPLMGSGVGGLDKKEVLNVYKEFFSKNTDLTCGVVIYGFNADDYAKIHDCFGNI